MAKPRPIEPPSPAAGPALIAELMPTTLPSMSTSGPPELPGLIAASVWIAGNVSVALGSLAAVRRGHRAVERRDDALRHGALEAERRADRDDLLADLEVIGAAERRRGQAALAVGLDDGEVGLGVGADDRRLGVRAVVERDRDRCRSSPATAMTWLLVRISPSLLMMMPVPEPDSSSPLTLICTTDGRTFAATCSTAPAGTLVLVTLPVSSELHRRAVVTVVVLDLVLQPGAADSRHRPRGPPAQARRRGMRPRASLLLAGGSVARRCRRRPGTRRPARRTAGARRSGVSVGPGAAPGRPHSGVCTLRAEPGRARREAGSRRLAAGCSTVGGSDPRPAQVRPGWSARSRARAGGAGGLDRGCSGSASGVCAGGAASAAERARRRQAWPRLAASRSVGGTYGRSANGSFESVMEVDSRASLRLI